MGISLDLYDFFAHLIPGGVFLIAFLYGFQESWLRSPAFTELNPVQLVGLGLVAYILGYVIDPIANRWYRCFRPDGPRNYFSQLALQSMVRELPWLVIDFKTLNWYVLLAYIKSHNLPMAQEIERLNVTHIMLRSISVGLLFLSFIFGLKIVTGTTGALSAVLSLMSLGASYLLVQEAIKFRIWFYQSIYQSALALKLQPEQLPVGYKTDM